MRIWNVLFIIFVGAVFIQVGCGRVYEDLTNNPKYSFMINKKFRIKREVMFFKYSSNRKRILMDKMGGGGDLPEKHEMKTKFPFKYGDTKILGVLPSGSEFKITKVFHEGSTGMSFIRYMAIIVKSKDQAYNGWEVSPSLLTFQTSNMGSPEFDQKYVEEIYTIPLD